MELLWGIRQVSQCIIINTDVLVCSCRVSKVSHDPLFFGVCSNLTLLSCVSVKFVYQRVKFSQSGKESLEMTRGDLGKAVSWDYQWWIFQPQLGGYDISNLAGHPQTVPAPTPGRFFIGIMFCHPRRNWRNWTHKLCRIKGQCDYQRHKSLVIFD